MRNRIACLMLLLVIPMATCRSPEESRQPESDNWYVYNVEVIYTDVAEGESDSSILLYYGLHDLWGSFDHGYISMTKIGGKKARCFIPKVLCSIADGRDIMGNAKHSVSVLDYNKSPLCQRGENIEIAGAYDLEISTQTYCSALYFKMAK